MDRLPRAPLTGKKHAQQTVAADPAGQDRVTHWSQDSDLRHWQTLLLQPAAIWPGQRGRYRPWLVPNSGSLPTAGLRHWTHGAGCTPAGPERKGWTEFRSQPPQSRVGGRQEASSPEHVQQEALKMPATTGGTVMGLTQAFKERASRRVWTGRLPFTSVQVGRNSPEM